MVVVAANIGSVFSRGYNIAGGERAATERESGAGSR
jgi:hypothetical protein